MHILLGGRWSAGPRSACALLATPPQLFKAASWLKLQHYGCQTVLAANIYGWVDSAQCSDSGCDVSLTSENRADVRKSVCGVNANKFDLQKGAKTPGRLASFSTRQYRVQKRFIFYVWVKYRPAAFLLAFNNIDLLAKQMSYESANIVLMLVMLTWSSKVTFSNVNIIS